MPKAFRARRQRRQGVCAWGGCPVFTQVQGLGGSCAPSPDNFEILFLKMVHSGAFLYALEVMKLEGFQ